MPPAAHPSRLGDNSTVKYEVGTDAPLPAIRGLLQVAGVGPFTIRLVSTYEGPTLVRRQLFKQTVSADEIIRRARCFVFCVSSRCNRDFCKTAAAVSYVVTVSLIFEEHAPPALFASCAGSIFFKQIVRLRGIPPPPQTVCAGDPQTNHRHESTRQIA